MTLKHNMMVAAAGLLLLLGCDRRQESANTAKPPEKTVDQIMSSNVPAVPPPFYIGRWAAKANLCGNGAWVINEKGLHTAGETSCTFDGAPRGAGPVEIDATCHAEGPPRKWRLRLSYAQSAQALLIENGPFEDTGLIRCGADEAGGPKSSASNATQPEDQKPAPAASPIASDASAAVDVLRTYFAFLESRRTAEAQRLWTAGGQADGTSPEAFADSFDHESYKAQVGTPGRVEGAAGSLYVEIPITLSPRQKDGSNAVQTGTATLRRSNDVPGSSDEQRRWHIYKIEMR